MTTATNIVTAAKLRSHIVDSALEKKIFISKVLEFFRNIKKTHYRSVGNSNCYSVIVRTVLNNPVITSSDRRSCHTTTKK